MSKRAADTDASASSSKRAKSPMPYADSEQGFRNVLENERSVLCENVFLEQGNINYRPAYIQACIKYTRYLIKQQDPEVEDVEDLKSELKEIVFRYNAVSDPIEAPIAVSSDLEDMMTKLEKTTDTRKLGKYFVYFQDVIKERLTYDSDTEPESKDDEIVLDGGLKLREDIKTKKEFQMQRSEELAEIFGLGDEDTMQAVLRKYIAYGGILLKHCGLQEALQFTGDLNQSKSDVNNMTLMDVSIVQDLTDLLVRMEDHLEGRVDLEKMKEYLVEASLNF